MALLPTEQKEKCTCGAQGLSSLGQSQPKLGKGSPTLSMLGSTHFGLLYYGAVFGALNLAQSMGTSTGPLFSGLVHDAVGLYVGAFTAAAVLLVIAIPAVLLVKKPILPTRGS